MLASLIKALQGGKAAEQEAVPKACMATRKAEGLLKLAQRAEQRAKTEAENALLEAHDLKGVLVQQQEAAKGGAALRARAGVAVVAGRRRRRSWRSRRRPRRPRRSRRRTRRRGQGAGEGDGRGQQQQQQQQW